MLKSKSLATHAQDDGFHEIQLNGKQLVFLFMAATVVSVVIFLCGVLVGRGVRGERVGATEAGTAESSPTELAAQSVLPATTPAGSDPTKAAPPPEVDDLTYFKRLEQKTDPAETLSAQPRDSKTKAPKQGSTPSRESTTASTRQSGSDAHVQGPAAAKAASPRDQASSSSSPKASADTPGASVSSGAGSAAPVPAQAPGPGFAVQVAALNVRGEADAIARRLAGKGYSAYVLTPASGTPSVYRVRVGTFKTRREAETVAAKLQREEQFKPWVTR
jgi:cell division septation protein DedD